MDIPLSPSQDINIRVKNVKGTLAGLDDETKTWTVSVQLDLELPEWNKDEDGNIVDNTVNIMANPMFTRRGIMATVKVSRAAIATQAGLDAPEDVAAMPAGEMEAAIIAVAMAKVETAFPGLTIPS